MAKTAVKKKVTKKVTKKVAEFPEGFVLNANGSISPKVEDTPAAIVTPPEVKAVVEVPPDPSKITWEKKVSKAKVPTKTSCIVIDKFNRWHENVSVELAGRDTSEYSWGCYGERYPVLLEQGDLLIPYIQTDMVGESPNRLWKASNPEGFRNTFKHTNSMLQKIQIGLMVALVFGIFFLIYILINQKAG